MKIPIRLKDTLHMMKEEIFDPADRIKNIAFIFAAAILLFCILTLLQGKSSLITSSEAAEYHNNYNNTSPIRTSQSHGDWQLILVNPWNVIPEDYDISLVEISAGHAVDERCAAALQQMLDDCRAAGLSPLICSSYRALEKQEQLYNEKINELTSQGYSLKDAREEAGRHVAVPGTSEHHLGLAFDIVDKNNQELNTSQEETPVQQWLMKNSWKYGFILRYPNGKSEITGIIYEPWHYRYVGKEAAAEIYEKDICLEEYLELRRDQD